MPAKAATVRWGRNVVGHGFRRLHAGVSRTEDLGRIHRLKRDPMKPLIPQRSPIRQRVEPGTYAWCTCGRAAQQPFCDGSHGDTGFAPILVQITESRSVAWCACKHTATPPFCDGSHRNLS